MRVSTSMMYTKGLQQMQAQSANLLKTQQQISSGRRILTPADDPIAAARALEIRQSQSVNVQFLANQAAAEDRLRTTENRLTGIGDVMQYMRERAVQAGNAALGSQELGYIATDLRGQFDALVALANSKDAQGDYVFSGFQTQQQPYVGSFGNYSYLGDDNSITVQVSSSRVMPVSFAGSDVFGSARLPDPGVMVQSVPGGNTAASFGVSLATTSLQPPAGISYAVGFDATSNSYSVTRRAADGTQTSLPVSFDTVAQTLSFDGGVVLNLHGTPQDGDTVQVFVGTNGITLGNSAIGASALNLSLAAGSAQPDAGIRYIVSYDEAAGDYLVTRREIDGTENPLGAASFDAAAGTLSFDGVSFNVFGTPQDGDTAQILVGLPPITVSNFGSASTGMSLAAGSAQPDAGVRYSLRFDAISDDYEVTRLDPDGTETILGAAGYDALAGTLSFDGLEFDITGLPVDGDVVQIQVGEPDILVANAGAPRASVQPLSLSLSPDSAEPDPGIRYIVSYNAEEGGYSVIRRQPGMADVSLDAVYDADSGTLSFDNGVIFDVSGTPVNGDQAEVFVASRDIFANFALFIDALERPGPTSMADGPVAFALDTFDMGLESVLRVRAQVGSQLVEIDNLGKVATDQNLQYSSEISRLEDLDYAEAISRLAQQQMFLEAAQQSYLRVTGLSLFNYLS